MHQKQFISKICLNYYVEKEKKFQHSNVRGGVNTPTQCNSVKTLQNFLHLWNGMVNGFSCILYHFLLLFFCKYFLLNNWILQKKLPFLQRNWVFATNLIFLIPFSCQPNSLHIRYFKLRLFNLTEFIIWDIKGLFPFLCKVLSTDSKSRATELSNYVSFAMGFRGGGSNSPPPSTAYPGFQNSSRDWVNMHLNPIPILWGHFLGGGERGTPSQAIHRFRPILG